MTARGPVWGDCPEHGRASWPYVYLVDAYQCPAPGCPAYLPADNL